MTPQARPAAPDYEAIDIDPLRNVPAEVLTGLPEPGSGRVKLRGLPFDLGSNTSHQAGRAWLGLGDGLSADPVRVPIGRYLTTVIVAHAVARSDIPANGPVGVPVAEYVFHLGDGSSHAVPIREHFEIGLSASSNDTTSPERLLDRLAAHPWLAVSDHHDRLHPRDGGPWAMAGRRMVECEQSSPAGFKLWVWTASSSVAVEALEIKPAGPPFVIGGITIGHADEHPFLRTGREPIVVELTDGNPLPELSSLSLRVDRGVATYVWPVAAESADDFLSADVIGWGEAPVAQATRAAAEVAAVPSATVELLAGETVLGRVRWGDVIDHGDASDGRIRVGWVDRRRNWVHTTVVDASTGRPIPCRINFRSPSGVAWQPHGHHSHVNSDLPSWHMDVGGDVRLGRVTYASIDGQCQGWLPQGDVLVEVVRGFEYEPLRTHVSIGAGQRQLRLELRRWSNLRGQGWASGDSHVHFLSVDGAHTEARAEDLDIVNLLQAQWGHLFTNTEGFTGQPSIDRHGDSIVFVGQENRQHMLGHLGLLGLHRPVMPWSSDGPAEAEIGGTLETTLSHWADEGHAAGALVTLPHFGYPNGEAAALIATGRVDAIEMIWQGEYFHHEYYRYLNAGYRLPLVGGTDKMNNEVPVGIYRTYAYLGSDEPLTYHAWKHAVAAGRTFLSAGPILHLQVEGASIGDTVHLPSTGGKIEVHAVAESAAPIHVLQLVVAGHVIAETAVVDGTRRLELRESVSVDGNTWIAARTGGPGYYHGRRTHCAFQRGVFAHTSPIYIACGSDAWTHHDSATIEYMVTRTQGLLAYVRDTASTTRIGGGGHIHAEADHHAWLERPFHEALTALQARRAAR